MNNNLFKKKTNKQTSCYLICTVTLHESELTKIQNLSKYMKQYIHTQNPKFPKNSKWNRIKLQLNVFQISSSFLWLCSRKERWAHFLLVSSTCSSNWAIYFTTPPHPQKKTIIIWSSKVSVLYCARENLDIPSFSTHSASACVLHTCKKRFKYAQFRRSSGTKQIKFLSLRYNRRNVVDYKDVFCFQLFSIENVPSIKFSIVLFLG